MRDQYHPSMSSIHKTSLLALLCYEYCLTFKHEVLIGWRRKVTATLLLFMLNRCVMLCTVATGILGFMLPVTDTSKVRLCDNITRCTKLIPSEGVRYIITIWASGEIQRFPRCQKIYLVQQSLALFGITESACESAVSCCGTIAP